jgi:hypothetical protein
MSSNWRQPGTRSALQAAESGSEEGSGNIQCASSLPADYTVKGNLLDAATEIQGIPAPRASAGCIELAPATNGTRCLFSEPESDAQAYQDPAGARCLLSFRLLGMRNTCAGCHASAERCMPTVQSSTHTNVFCPVSPLPMQRTACFRALLGRTAILGARQTSQTDDLKGVSKEGAPPVA